VFSLDSSLVLFLTMEMFHDWLCSLAFLCKLESWTVMSELRSSREEASYVRKWIPKEQRFLTSVSVICLLGCAEYFGKETGQVVHLHQILLPHL
jgi:hypothetical protein